MYSVLNFIIISHSFLFNWIFKDNHNFGWKVLWIMDCFLLMDERKKQKKQYNYTYKRKNTQFRMFYFYFYVVVFLFFIFSWIKTNHFWTLFFYFIKQILAYMKGESKKMIIILPITFLLIDYYSFNQRNFTFVKIFFIVLLGCQRHAREAQAYCMLCRF